MKMKRLLVLSMIPFITACSSTFGIGYSSFRCEGTDKGGVCAPTDKVYQDRYLLLNQDEDKKTKKVEKKDSEVIGSNKICEVKQGQEQSTGLCPIQVRVIQEKPFAEPIRVQPQISKVWIQPYVDKDGNLVDGRYVYVVVKKGGWLLPDGTKIYDDDVVGVEENDK